MIHTSFRKCLQPISGRLICQFVSTISAFVFFSQKSYQSVFDIILKIALEIFQPKGILRILSSNARVVGYYLTRNRRETLNSFVV